MTRFAFAPEARGANNNRVMSLPHPTISTLRGSESGLLRAFTLVEIMIVVVIIGLLASLAIPAFKKIHQTSQDRTVLNNARQISSAADQYFMEMGVSSVALATLIGQTNYIKEFQTVASETYPTNLVAGTTITITGVGGSRTITYEH
jgi:type IV pilus assembly protein PilA